MRFVFILLFIVESSICSLAIDLNILAYGAQNDKNVLSTSAIQLAINEARTLKNARVIIPKGNFLTGTITMYSNVELHLEQGATLYGSTNINDYYALSRTTATFNWKALILSNGQQNITISGKGTIDGQGEMLALNIDDMFYNGTLDSNNYQLIERRPKAHVRPQLIQFVNCSNVRVESIKIKNASSWVQVYDLCNNVTIREINVESVAYWNNDGIDLIDCKNVVLTDSKFNCSDDGICLKSYKRNSTIQPKCDSIYIKNCTVRSSASAVKLGTSSFGGFTNIYIENIKVYDTYRSAIAIESWETGIIDNVHVKNITAINTGNALFIKLNKRKIYDHLPNGKINNIFIDNIKCTVPFIQPDIKYNLRGPALPFFHNTFPISITGIPNAPVTNIHISNLKIIYPGNGQASYANSPTSRLDQVPEKIEEYPEFSMFGELPAWGLYTRHVDNIAINNIYMKIRSADYRPALVFDDVLNLKLEQVTIKGDNKRDKVVKVKTTELN